MSQDVPRAPRKAGTGPSLRWIVGLGLLALALAGVGRWLESTADDVRDVQPELARNAELPGSHELPQIDEPLPADDAALTDAEQAEAASVEGAPVAMQSEISPAPEARALIVPDVGTNGFRPLEVFVLDEVGQPVPDCTVAARALFGWADAKGTTLAEASTGPDGRCVLWLPPERFDVFARHERAGTAIARSTTPESADEPAQLRIKLAQPVRLRGIVRDVDGTPRPGAEVSVAPAYTMVRLYVKPVVTDAHGRFSFLLDASYLVVHVAAVWQDLRAVETVNTGFERDCDLMFSGAPVPMVGRLVDATGKAVAAAKLIWRPRPESTTDPRGKVMSPTFEATTDAAGRFEVTFPRPGSYVGEVDAEGFVQAAEITSTLSERVRHDVGDIPLLTAAVIEGTLRDHEGSLVGSATVTADVAALTPPEHIARGAKAVTDTWGHFELVGLQPGWEYLLRAELDRAEQGRAEPGAPVIAMAGARHVQLRLDPPQPAPRAKPIEVLVVDETTGSPITAVQICVNGTPWFGAWPDVVQSADGRYPVMLTATSPVAVHVRAPGYAPSVPVFERPELAPDVLTLALDRPTDLDVEVHDERDEPVAGASVTCNPWEPEPFALWHSDPPEPVLETKKDGHARWSAVAPHEYLLQARDGRRLSAPARIHVGGGAPVKLVLVLKEALESGSLDVVVLRANGSAAVAQEVSLVSIRPGEGPTASHATTDEDGRARFDDVMPGHVFVLAASIDLQKPSTAREAPPHQAVMLTEGAHMEVELRLP